MDFKKHDDFNKILTCRFFRLLPTLLLAHSVCIQHVTQFFFLEKPYLISLQLSRCGSSSDVFQVQINLEGSEGTVVFPVKHQCQHLHVYGLKWYYSAFTDRFIGEPKKFYFMVCLLGIMH